MLVSRLVETMLQIKIYGRMRSK